MSSTSLQSSFGGRVSFDCRKSGSSPRTWDWKGTSPGPCRYIRFRLWRHFRRFCQKISWQQKLLSISANALRTCLKNNSFYVFRNNKLKIGLNTTANKLHCISDLIGYDMLNSGFVHFKKLAKIQFLKFGKTWVHPWPIPRLVKCTKSPNSAKTV